MAVRTSVSHRRCRSLTSHSSHHTSSPPDRSVRVRSLEEVPMHRTLAALLLVPVSLLACGGDGAKASDDPSGLATVFDSSRADTIVARVAGQVAPEKVRTLVEEMRVQPGADDTTLFAEA